MDQICLSLVPPFSCPGPALGRDRESVEFERRVMVSRGSAIGGERERERESLGKVCFWNHACIDSSSMLMLRVYVQ